MKEKQLYKKVLKTISSTGYFFNKKVWVWNIWFEYFTIF